MLHSLGKAKVDSIERHDQILGVIDLLKSFDHTGLASDVPSKILVRDRILQAHAFLRNVRELVFVDG